MTHPTNPTPPRPLRDWLTTLSARYDAELLRDAPTEPSPTKGAPPDTATASEAAALRAWCERGSGDGRAPLWRPWVLPDMAERLSLALWSAHAAPPSPARLAALMRGLDRNQELAELAARSGLAAVRLKLGVKWRELGWWLARHPQQAWDTGYLRDGPKALARLAGFRPRRPTLVVVQGLPEASLAEALGTLQAVQAGFRHPVRLLLLDPLPDTLAAQAPTATRLGDR